MNVLRGIASVACLVVVLGGEVRAADPPEPKDGPLGMKFVALPKGTTYLGWNGTKGSAKKTQIKEDFEIAMYTVTQGQWTELMGKNPSYFSRDGEGKDRVKDIEDEELKQFPVEQVSWDDCQEFVKKLNEQEEGKGYLYRLPTEQEWEYACRGGATTQKECSYHFYFAQPTNDISSKQANFNGESPFGKGERGPYLYRPTRVGSYPANNLGLFDMHGNVWQWTASLREPGASTQVNKRVDMGPPGGPPRPPVPNRPLREPGAPTHVNKGSSYFDFGEPCQAAFHRTNAPSKRFHGLGFRLARVPSAPGK